MIMWVDEGQVLAREVKDLSAFTNLHLVEPDQKENEETFVLKLTMNSVSNYFVVRTPEDIKLMLEEARLQAAIVEWMAGVIADPEQLFKK